MLRNSPQKLVMFFQIFFVFFGSGFLVLRVLNLDFSLLPVP